MGNQNPSQNYQKNIKWRSVKRPNYLFNILLVAAFFIGLLAIALLAVIAASSLLNIPLADYLPGINSLPPLRQIYATVAILLFVALILVILARWRLLHNESFQFVNGCPSCQRHDLIRVHRQRYQRLTASLLRIPLRSYACRNCQWQGVLLFSTANIPASSLAEEAVDSDQVGGAAEENLENEVSAVPVAEHPVSTITEQIAVEETGVTAAADQPTNQEYTHPPPKLEVPNVTAAGAPEETSKSLGAASEISIRSEIELVDESESGEGHPDLDIESADDNDGSAVFDDTNVAAVEQATRVYSQPSAEINETKIEDRQDPAIETVRAIVVAPFGLSMRLEPDRDAAIVLTLEPDTIVEIVEGDMPNPTASWRQVRAEGKIGWASAAFLKYLQR